jgi:hypothetical protein
MITLPTPAASLAPVPVLPDPGARVSTNTPTLAWEPVEADRIEIWIDGRKEAEVPGWRTDYVPFPLSFGEHEWHLRAVEGDTVASSPSSRFTVDDAPLAPLPPGALLLRHGWKVQSSLTAGTDGRRLSTSAPDGDDWCETSVPATALTALVRNGVYPNPYDGLNNTRIPDAHDRFNQLHDTLRFSHVPGANPWSAPYWFVKSFEIPDALAGRRVRLTFSEINYRAEIWLNGVRIGTPDTVVGMERAFHFDVGDVLVSGANTLAVAVHPLDHPGLPDTPPTTPLADPGRNMGADTAISLGYTKWDTVGWDWQPEVRDRDMGITEDVFLAPVDPVETRDVHVATRISRPHFDEAEIDVRLTLANHEPTASSGEIRVRVVDDRGAIVAAGAVPFLLGPSESRPLALGSDVVPALRIAHPRLWWPFELGEPVLHTLEIEVAPAARAPTKTSVVFGIRSLDTFIDPVPGSRVFLVNGKRIYGHGGNWVLDMMLNWTASRYEAEVEAARRSRINMLRVWGPTGVPPSCFFAAADRAGVLVWQDFLHDHWGTDNNKPGAEPPLEVFEAATIDVIRKLRNHPSLFLWCGGNEGPNPREELITRELLPEHDPSGSRHYLTASLADGLHGGGPYHTLSPLGYAHNPKLRGFNSEIGPSGVPEWESIIQFLDTPPAEWADDRFPLDGAWAYHDANDRPGEDERKFTLFDDLLRSRYGDPVGTDLATAREYVRKAQFVGYEAYRAAVETLNRARWRDSTGFALWKFNSSWPSLVWQIVDWYQRPTSGFYAVRRACAPLHVQFDPDVRTVTVVNRTATPRRLHVRASLHTIEGARLWERFEPVDVVEDSTLTTTWRIPPESELALLELELAEAGHAVVSSNTYWISPDDDFRALAHLPETSLHGTARLGASSPDFASVDVRLRNSGGAPVVLARLALVDARSGSELLPSWWSDNYVSLLPDRSIELRVDVAPDRIGPDTAVRVSGDNFPPILVPLGGATR